MKDFIKETYREQYFVAFNINRKKFKGRRIKTAFALFIITIVIAKLFNPLLFALAPLALYIGYKLPYYELCKFKKSQDLIKQFMFPTFVRHFLSLLDTQGNVYKTLEKTADYVKDPIKTELKNMVLKLKESKGNNRQIYMDFAYFVGSPEATMIMGMIYEFDKEGIQKSELKELENMLTILQENRAEEMLEYKVNKMNSFATPVMLYTVIYLFLFSILTQAAYIKNSLDF